MAAAKRQEPSLTWSLALTKPLTRGSGRGMSAGRVLMGRPAGKINRARPERLNDTGGWPACFPFRVFASDSQAKGAPLLARCSRGVGFEDVCNSAFDFVFDNVFLFPET